MERDPTRPSDFSPNSSSRTPRSRAPSGILPDLHLVGGADGSEASRTLCLNQQTFSQRQLIDDSLKKFALQHNLGNIVLPPSTNSSSNSLPLMVAPPTDSFFGMNYAPRNQNPEREALILSMVQDVRKIIVEGASQEINFSDFCDEILKYICGLLRMEIGAIYLNQSKKNTHKEWTPAHGLPSLEDFTDHFAYSSGVELIRKAATERKAISARSSNGNLFLFCPLRKESFSYGMLIVGAMVASLSLTDVQNSLHVLGQFCKEISKRLLALSESKDKELYTTMKKVRSENKALKQNVTFSKSLLVMSRFPRR
eukprot:TRINITY_DN12867_c0_g1_i2.p1 TRINITY_DN12867_c0_g1~~TRINITY_DN12867_c0_g1_i2.p1  ORF type:complete len:311 (-),score=52.51 TRINITY_DN12867_c0_g1_i2:103-1035(-)